MADTINATLNAVASVYRKTPLDLGDVINTQRSEFSAAIDYGTSASQCDIVWADTRTVTTGANDDIDLRALSDTIYGSAVTFVLAKLSYLYIYNKTATTLYYLNLDSSVANGCTALFDGGATSKVRIGPSSVFVVSSIVDAFTVDATHKVIRIHNNAAGSITYDIVVAGRSV